MRVLLHEMRGGREDEWNILIAGLVAGLGILADAPQRRKTIAMYVLVRALDDHIRAKISLGDFHPPKHSAVALFSLIQMPLMYSFLCEPEIMDRAYYKWVCWMGNMSDQQLVGFYRPPSGVGEKAFIPCQPAFHDHACLTSAVIEYVRIFKDSLRVYVPVHLVPALVFRRKLLMSNASEFVRRTAENISTSCFFLSAYVSVMRSSQCALRNARGADARWHSLVGGFFAGLALQIERPSRRSELTLYTGVKSLEVVVNWIKSRFPRLVGKMAHVDVLAFSVGLALTVHNYYCFSHEMKNINRTIVDHLFKRRTPLVTR